jgi:RNA polymerase sigma factor (sigma-70 family)
MSDTEQHSSDDQRSDADLIRACRGGDRKAIRTAMGTLWQRHHLSLVLDLQCHCGDYGRAEDAAMDAWTIVLVKIRHVDESRPFRAWLTAVGRNCLISNWRHNRRQQPVGQAGKGEMEQGLLDMSLARTDSAAVTAALELLNPKNRQLLEMKYLQGRTLQEIAEVLDIPPGTVGSRLFQAREQFRIVFRGLTG